jgi:hypothetical protein
VLLFVVAGRVLLRGPLIATHLAAGVGRGAAEGEVVVTSVDGALVEWMDEADVVVGEVADAVPVRSVDPLTPLHRLPLPVRTAADLGGTRPHGRRPVVPTLPQALVSARAGGTPIAPAGRPPTTGGASPGNDLAALLSAAEQLGSASATTDMAVSHARTRSQFGQVIGAFQAVKHLCAEMLVRTEVARAAVYGAAVTLDPVEVAGAKLLADEAAVQCARDCLQVHGGMGFTWEADVHLHLKRAWVRAERWPTAAVAEETVAAAL